MRDGFARMQKFDREKYGLTSLKVYFLRSGVFSDPYLRIRRVTRSLVSRVLDVCEQPQRPSQRFIFGVDDI